MGSTTTAFNFTASSISASGGSQFAGFNFDIGSDQSLKFVSLSLSGTVSSVMGSGGNYSETITNISETIKDANNSSIVYLTTSGLTGTLSVGAPGKFTPGFIALTFGGTNAFTSPFLAGQGITLTGAQSESLSFKLTSAALAGHSFSTSLLGGTFSSSS